MNKARITLKCDVTLHTSGGTWGPWNLPAGKVIECSYEDCLGTMLPKFYYPADPAEFELRSPYGRPAGTKREPSYQVPADAIEKAECDDPEVIARWERLYEERTAKLVEDGKRDVITLCRCMHRRDDHGREGSWPCFRCVCTEFEPDFFGNEEDVCRRCGVESEAHSPGPCTYDAEADVFAGVAEPTLGTAYEERLTIADAIDKVKPGDTVSFHAVNGVPATLDVASCFTDAELAAIYAKGSR